VQTHHIQDLSTSTSLEDMEMELRFAVKNGMYLPAHLVQHQQQGQEQQQELFDAETTSAEEVFGECMNQMGLHLRAYKLRETFVHKVKRRRGNFIWLTVTFALLGGFLAMFVVGVTCSSSHMKFCSKPRIVAASLEIVVGLLGTFVLFFCWLSGLFLWRTETFRKSEYENSFWPSDYAGCC